MRICRPYAQDTSGRPKPVHNIVRRRGSSPEAIGGWSGAAYLSYAHVHHHEYLYTSVVTCMGDVFRSSLQNNRKGVHPVGV